MRNKLCLAIIISALLISGVKDFLDSGDRKSQLNKYELALEDYSEALRLEPENAQVMWRMGYIHNRLALNSKGEVQHNHFTKASEYLSSCLAINPNIAQAHTELARLLIHMELMSDVWSSYTLARRVKEELDYALKLEPKLADTYYLMGLWNQRVSVKPILWRRPLGLAEASNEKGIEYYEKAVELEKDNILYLYRLAQLQIQEGDKKSGMKNLEKLIKLTPRDNFEKEIKNEAENIYKDSSS